MRPALIIAACAVVGLSIPNANADRVVGTDPYSGITGLVPVQDRGIPRSTFRGQPEFPPMNYLEEFEDWGGRGAGSARETARAMPSAPSSTSERAFSWQPPSYPTSPPIGTPSASIDPRTPPGSIDPRMPAGGMDPRESGARDPRSAPIPAPSWRAPAESSWPQESWRADPPGRGQTWGDPERSPSYSRPDLSYPGVQPGGQRYAAPASPSRPSATDPSWPTWAPSTPQAASDLRSGSGSTSAWGSYPRQPEFQPEPMPQHATPWGEYPAWGESPMRGGISPPSFPEPRERADTRSRSFDWQR